MLEPVKDMLRRQSLKKNASTEPTGFVPLSKIRSAVAFIDVEDTSFNECKNTLLLFFREHNIKGDIFFFDFRELTPPPSSRRTSTGSASLPARRSP